jgi:chaperonin GroES
MSTPGFIEGDAMKLRPLHDRVIVKRLEQETKTASGIVIPDNAAEKPDQGEVLAVGPGRKTDKGELIALNVKVGDRVLFGKYSGQTVKVDGDELLVMKEDDLFAVVEGAPPPASRRSRKRPPNSSQEVTNNGS